MMETILTKNYSGLMPDPKEILRYAGMSKDSQPDALMMACLEELGEIRGRVCWRRFPVIRTAEGMDLGFCRTPSASLGINLQGCSSLILFAGTLGLDIDRLLAKYGRLSPAKALWFQAIGAAGVEALCDAFCEDVRILSGSPGDPARTKPRYSPGFGDFGLEYQPFIFEALDCPRTIGLTLTDSFLMSPTKSVTELICILDETK